MKIFRSGQIRKIDEFTIRNEPVSSVDLMERAAGQLFKWCIDRYERSRRFIVFAGPGNNGGDGLALARMLHSARYETCVYYLNFTEKTTDDWKINRQRLEKETGIPFKIISEVDHFPVIYSGDVIIDAIFGSGLARPAKGLAADIIRKINSLDSEVIAVDIPSGLFSEDNSDNLPENIIRADYTLCFQFPKLSFMFAENRIFTGEWVVLPIGLHPEAIRGTESSLYLTDTRDILPLLKKRMKFDHKGDYGHGLLIAGSYGKMGAAILGAKAALRTGIGLITCHIPSCGYEILQSSVPEAMVITDNSDIYISEISDPVRYNALAIGPGTGTDPVTQAALHKLLLNCHKPMIIDADGLNILGLNKDWLSLLPENTILTPHPKEFERIAGKSDNSFKSLEKQVEFSGKYKCVVVVKGAYTSISTPDGRVYFNTTGNPGMATAGSGDALTGIILSLLSQGYPAENASLAGVFLHGLAGDLAAVRSGFETLIASDIIENIGNAFMKMRSFSNQAPERN